MASDTVLPATYDVAFHGDVSCHPYISKLPYRQLGKTDLRLSLLSYGGVSLGNFYGEVDPTEAIETVQESIKSGINFLDTSPWYGCSEDVLGVALKPVPRNTYYISTKVGRNFTPTWEGRFDFSGPAVLKSFERSLTRLGLSHVDIIQVHDVEFCTDFNIIVKETLPALESIVRAGKAKYIGITGYDLNVLKEISSQANCVDSILSYCRYNLYDLSLADYLPYFKEKNIGVVNASPVAMGLLTTAGPPDWHPATPEIKQNARKAAAYAKERSTSLEKVALGFSLRPKEETIATTLVSIPTRKILQENLDIVTKPRTKEDDELYADFRHIFNNANCHWEGGEVAEYKRSLFNEAF